MKNLPILLSLGLGLALISAQVQAMDNQKQLIVSPRKAIQALDFDSLPFDAFASPEKIKEGKKEVASPTKKSSPAKMGGMTQAEIDQLLASGAFNSPEKAIAATPSMISPAGKMTVGFRSPEKCFAELTDKKLSRPGVRKPIGTWLEIANAIHRKAVAKPDSTIVVNYNAYEKDQTRSVNCRALQQLSEVVPNLYIFNAKKELKDFNGKPVSLHTKTTSWINEHGLPRVCGMGSDNLTQQSIKNQEMSLYSKDPQDRQAHEAFLQRILPYCTKYSQLTQGVQGGGGFSQVIDFRKLPPIPMTQMGTTPFSFYTDQYNAEPLIKMFLREKARKVSTYAISDSYLTAIEANKNCDLIVNKECYKNNVVLQTLASIIARGNRAAVFTESGAELHNKFALCDDDTTIIGEGNFTPTGISGSFNKFSLFFKNKPIFDRCNEEFEKQMKHPEIQLVKPDGGLQPKKRSISSNNNNDNNNDETRKGERIKRALFDAGSNFRTQ